jgi:hypothetical protein
MRPVDLARQHGRSTQAVRRTALDSSMFTVAVIAALKDYSWSGIAMPRRQGGCASACAVTGAGSASLDDFVREAIYRRTMDGAPGMKVDGKWPPGISVSGGSAPVAPY